MEIMVRISWEHGMPGGDVVGVMGKTDGRSMQFNLHQDNDICGYRLEQEKNGQTQHDK